MHWRRRLLIRAPAGAETNEKTFNVRAASSHPYEEDVNKWKVFPFSQQLLFIFPTTTTTTTVGWRRWLQFVSRSVVSPENPPRSGWVRFLLRFFFWERGFVDFLKLKNYCLQSVQRCDVENWLSAISCLITFKYISLIREWTKIHPKSSPSCPINWHSPGLPLWQPRTESLPLWQILTWPGPESIKRGAMINCKLARLALDGGSKNRRSGHRIAFRPPASSGYQIRQIALRGFHFDGEDSAFPSVKS